ncbi:MAG: FliI/YscN family ATPase [Deltaproteobacteria bacterium]|nr:FliI/YscN family ATPase [Deltaproteobacteria bacterium]
MNKNIFKNAANIIESVQVPVIEGTVISAGELYFEASLPFAKPGSIIEFEALLGQIISVKDNNARIAPLNSAPMPAVGDKVTLKQKNFMVSCGQSLLGRVIDPLYNPLDGKGPIENVEFNSVEKIAINPFDRKRVDTFLPTGIKVIDAMLSLGKGQRIGLFAGPGVGKSTLLGDLTKNSGADVNVICLVGERGREASEFVHEILGEKGLKNSVVILATSDSPPAQRTLALYCATTIAEWFRDEKKVDVLFLVDSLSRVVRAKRDIDFSHDKQNESAGFPLSALSILPNLLERAGCGINGTITAVYTVLTDSSNDDPVKNELQSLLDGHIFLNKNLADMGHWPAIDILSSVSRVMKLVKNKKDLENAETLKRVIAAYKSNEDLILLGAYQKGSSKDTDIYIKNRDAIENFLTQKTDENFNIKDTQSELEKLITLLR